MSAIEVAIQSPKEAKSRGRPRKSVLSVCEEPSGVDVLLDLRRELDDQAGVAPEPPLEGNVSPDKKALKEALKAEKAAAKLAAKEEANADGAATTDAEAGAASCPPSGEERLPKLPRGSLRRCKCEGNRRARRRRSCRRAQRSRAAPQSGTSRRMGHGCSVGRFDSCGVLSKRAPQLGQLAEGRCARREEPGDGPASRSCASVSMKFCRVTSEPNSTPSASL